MKINSNTIKLEKESFEKLEEVVKKIASENEIENVKEIKIKLSKKSGVVKFAIGDDGWENLEHEDADTSKWIGYEEIKELEEQSKRIEEGKIDSINHGGGEIILTKLIIWSGDVDPDPQEHNMVIFKKGPTIEELDFWENLNLAKKYFEYAKELTPTVESFFVVYDLVVEKYVKSFK